MFWYCFREREMILDLFEMAQEPACTPATSRSAGSRRTFRTASIPNATVRGLDAARARGPISRSLDRNQIWLERTKGIGLLSADDAIALGQTDLVLRASGVDWDLRRDEPYLAYGQVDFKSSRLPDGDVYDRYRVRVDEMRESTRIVEQCLRRLETPEGPPVDRGRPQGRAAPREELHTSMETLIHHVKIVTEGYRVPEGEVYVATESPRGEQGCYLGRRAVPSRGGCIPRHRRSSRSRPPRPARTTRSSPT